ncbi:hypothetical protein [Amycolatopsis methanolica]|uniref:Mycothiol-dependent maleylpyruvate isomerase metal-binding domain-containing protein n=1 Tax=Amycolatopsis methanolica 239 TaxID=1068978 RepID=A0A076MN19_AMYME|nr:hypothetical protein [Amycolatopsis methanolica]AIJ22069.1 hypothetical protein AMETH_1977 [Amycolatopsis methanolica 239]
MADVITGHLDDAVQLALGTLRTALDADWDVPAGDLDWSCWETAEHLSDDVFGYAVRLGPRTPPRHGEVPYLWQRLRPGGPSNAVRADRYARPAGPLRVVEVSAALLTAMVRTTPAHVRAWHVWGDSDPAGFAAMGIVQTLVHTHDLAAGLGLAWEPPGELCEPVVRRLFPHVAPDEPWPTLLWATGRGELPGRARLGDWRWYAAPLTSP